MKHNYELYSYQIACIDTLEKRKLITKKEHDKFKKHIQKNWICFFDAKNWAKIRLYYRGGY